MGKSSGVGGAVGPIGLDIGARYLKAAQLRRERDTWAVSALATVPRRASEKGDDKSSAPRPIDLEEATRIGDVLFRRGFVGSNLVLAVPDARLMIANLELPPRSADVPLDQIARAEFARTLKCESEAFEFSYWDLPAPARAARSTNVMGVGCRHDDCDSTLAAFAAAGLEVCSIDVSACALARACEPWVSSPQEITAVVDVGWHAARLMILHRGVVCYQRALVGYGMQRLSNAITDDLDLKEVPELVDFVLRSINLIEDEAPEAATPTVTGDRRATPGVSESSLEDARRAARAHFDAVMAEVMTSLSYSSHQYPDAPVTRVMLCGGGANVRGVGQYLSSNLGMDVRAVKPCEVVRFAPEFESMADDASLLLSMGLARHDVRASKKKGAAA